MNRKHAQIRFLWWLLPALVLSVAVHAQGPDVVADTPPYAPPTAAVYEDAPVQVQRFDRAKWEAVTKDLDYTDKADRKAKKAKEAEEDPLEVPDINWGLVDLLLKIVFFGGMAVVVALLLVHLLGYKPPPRNRKLKALNEEGDIDVAQIEEAVQDTDIEPYIRHAIAQGQYALAVRLYYLLTLQTLTRAGQIQWKKDKTNHDYVREMQKSQQGEAFRRLTRSFESAWYGNQPIDEGAFYGIEGSFQDFLRQNTDLDER